MEIILHNYKGLFGNLAIAFPAEKREDFMN
jgi:hypothetical protein